MIDHSTKKSILEKIIHSNTFDKTDKYARLLTYLVESSLCEKIPKEYSIAVDVFDRDKGFNPSQDTIVRYYMHRLRKKLNDYYANAGKNDKIILVIPKGHYEVKFIPRSKNRGEFWQSFKKRDWILISTIVLLASTALLFYYKYLSLAKISRIIDHPIDKDDPVWSGFFENQLPTVLIIGDHLLTSEYDKDSGGYREQVDYSINTQPDFNKFTTLHPERFLKKLDHGSIPHNSIFNLHDIEHVFYSFYHQPDIQFTSEYMAKPTDLPKIVEHNIIYMGGFRNLRQLNQIFDKLPIEFTYTDAFRGEIRIHDPHSDSLLVFKSMKLKEEHFLDLGIIAKLPGPNLENYLFLIGFAYPAQIETVRMISRQESLLKLYHQTAKQKNAFPEYFYLVVEFTSFEYTVQETNIRYFREISKD